MNQDDFEKLFKFVCTERDKDPFNNVLYEITNMMIGMSDDQGRINEIFNELGWD